MKSELRSLIFTIVLTILFFFGGVEAHSIIQVAVPDTSAESGDTIAIPIIVSDLTGEEIYAFQCSLSFDNAVLMADSAYSTGTITEVWGSPTFNCAPPGQIYIAMAGISPLSGSGVLVYVVFIVNGSEGDTTTIHFGEIWLNETPPDVITDGLFEVSPDTDVKEENEFSDPPNKFTLFQNYPNPFNPVTSIQYTVGGRQTPIPASHEKAVDGSQFAVHSPIHTTLKVYNILGELVRTLVDESKEAGSYIVIWDGKDNHGKEVASGIYFYRLKAGEFTLTKRMLLLK